MNAVTTPKLDQLSRHYGNVGDRPAGERFYDAFQRYLKANRESLFDLTLTAASAEVVAGQNIADLDPHLIDAIHITNPSLADEHFFELTGGELQGAVNTAKGKYFEYLVADRLNAGKQVGPILLPEGYHAVLADSLNQPGWDMQIIGPDGAAADYLQLKATDSAGYIQEALHRYPDIEILATHEVAHSGLVLDSGITESDLHDHVSSAIDVMDDSVTERFLDYFSPLSPLVAIATWEGYKVSVGQQSLAEGSASLQRNSPEQQSMPSAVGCWQFRPHSPEASCSIATGIRRQYSPRIVPTPTGCCRCAWLSKADCSQGRRYEFF